MNLKSCKIPVLGPRYSSTPFRFILLVALTVFLVGLSCEDGADISESSSSKPFVKVALVKYGSHSVLDAIEGGMIGLLQDTYDTLMVLNKYNAQFANTHVSSIARELPGKDYDLVITLTTPVTQTVASYFSKVSQPPPILFSFVTNPSDLHLDTLGLVGQVAGMSDLVDYEGNLRLIKVLFPTVEKLAYLIDRSESNSVAILARFQETAAKFGLDIKEYPVIASSDVKTTAEEAAQDVDAFLVGGDHKVVSALGALLKVAESNNLPTFCIDETSVSGGCLAASAIRYEEFGEATGRAAVRLLSGIDPLVVGITDYSDFVVTVNGEVAEQFNISVDTRQLQGQTGRPVIVLPR